MLKFDPRLTVHAEDFDRDNWVLNTPAGIVDLRLGKVIPPDPSVMLSKSTRVAPMPGDAPEWFRFLREATGGDETLQRFLQKQMGYILTGDTSEQTLSFIWGYTNTGKTTFIEAMAGLLGDYAVEAPMETFVSSKSDRHPTDLAGLIGARLVTAEETQNGRRWDEQRVKKITGGGRLRVRFMHQNFFEYRPRFKLVVIGNHEPEIGNVDDAMRRRIHIVPFTVRPKQIDRQLGDKIRREWPQVLAWLIEGCTLWQQEGLQPPEVVVARTKQYFDEEDPLGQWIGDTCVIEEDATSTRQDLYRSWQQWCHTRGEQPGTFKQFKRQMDPKRDLGFREWQVGDRKLKGYRGIRLVTLNGEDDEFTS